LGRTGVDVRLPLQPGKLGGFVPGQGTGLKGRAHKGLRTEPDPSLPQGVAGSAGMALTVLRTGGLIALWRATEAP
jgi:hypothetical protein